jgi:glycosyltransferase involved in cell wall biosynthesis
LARWVYLANIRLPSERANAVHVLNQCQALIQAGEEVDLLLARRLVASPEAGKLSDLAQSMGLELLPRIKALPCLDLTWWADRLPEKPSLLIFYLQHLTFLALALVVVFLKPPGRLHTREVFLPLLGGWLLKLQGVRLSLELHDFPRSRFGLWIHRHSLRQVDGLVVISQGLAREVRASDLKPRRLLVLPDAVSDRFFNTCGSRPGLRRRLSLPQDGPLVLYAGGLYWAWKGVATLIKAQQFLDDRAWLVVVGGSPQAHQAHELKTLAESMGLKRVILTGFVPPAEVPAFLQAADVLVLPNSAKAEISRSYTSPLKLFEYLASSRPVVASDLPSLREVLIHGVNAWLVRPDDPAALAAGITTLLDAPDFGRKLADRGQKTALDNTWYRRARQLIDLAA